MISILLSLFRLVSLEQVFYNVTYVKLVDCVLQVLSTIIFCVSVFYQFIFFIFFIFFNNYFIYLVLAVLGLRFCARAFSSCGERGPLFITVRGPLTIAASLVAEHRLQTRRLSSCGSRAQLLCGMWDLPGPGLEPVSPALAGRFPTTAPPGKPYQFIFKCWNLQLSLWICLFFFSVLSAFALNILKHCYLQYTHLLFLFLG